MPAATPRYEQRGAPVGSPAARPPPPPQEPPPAVTLTRGQLVRKDVVTRTSGVKLGVASQLWVDTDEWEVMALDVRPPGSLLSGLGGAVDHVLMSSLRQVGDVILVHDERAVERRWSSYGLSTVVGCDVVTERGTYIGRVRDYEFDPEDGLVQRVVVDALGLPLVPEGVVSTYALDVSEILSTGLDRIIVAEGAEARVEQLSVSLLQRLQLTAPPWEDDLATYADYYAQDWEAQQRQRMEWEQQQTMMAMQRGQQWVSPPSPQQQQTQQWNAPPAPPQQQAPPPPPPPQQGIPLIRRSEPFERRDADGGYGEQPQQTQQQQSQTQTQTQQQMAFNDWVVREQRVREMEMVGENRAAAAAAAAAGQTLVSSPPPPPPGAWTQASPPSAPRGGEGPGERSEGTAAREKWDAAGGGGSPAPSGRRRGFDADEDML